MTERFNGAETTLLEHLQTIEEAETLRVSPEVPRVLARRAFVLDVIGSDTAPEPASLLSRGRRQAAEAALETGAPFNSSLMREVERLNFRA